jgi:hypothetical protein
MHKSFISNGIQVLYKVEDNGRIIENVNILIIKTDNTLSKENFSILNGNYIKFASAPEAGEIIVFYDNKLSSNSYQEQLSAISKDIEILKEGLLKRITLEEINLYIEKLKSFNSL